MIIGAIRGLVCPSMQVSGAGRRARDALRDALAGQGGGPQLIDARIDPAAYAHVLAATRGL